jgi:antitoxin component HigA of HigAB toxin-antitoxin module
MEIHPIDNECDYQEVLRSAAALVDADPAPGTPDGDRLQLLATLIEQYEAEHVPFGPRRLPSGPEAGETSRPPPCPSPGEDDGA